jgi:hypothetical protein
MEIHGAEHLPHGSPEKNWKQQKYLFYETVGFEHWLYSNNNLMRESSQRQEKNLLFE